MDVNLRSDSTFLAHFKILKLYVSLSVSSPPYFGRELTILVTSAQRGVPLSPYVTRQLHDKGKLRLRRGSKVSSRIMALHKSVV